jgi:hypothetical protein
MTMDFALYLIACAAAAFALGVMFGVWLAQREHDTEDEHASEALYGGEPLRFERDLPPEPISEFPRLTSVRNRPY